MTNRCCERECGEYCGGSKKDDCAAGPQGASCCVNSVKDSGQMYTCNEKNTPPCVRPGIRYF